MVFVAPEMLYCGMLVVVFVAPDVVFSAVSVGTINTRRPYPGVVGVCVGDPVEPWVRAEAT